MEENIDNKELSDLENREKISKQLEEKNIFLTEKYSEKLKDIDDILQIISLWGLKCINDKNIDLEEIRDISNKISECNVVIHKILNYKEDDNVLKDALLKWVEKENTPIEFKEKYR